MPYHGYVCEKCADYVPDYVECDYVDDEAVGHRCLTCGEVITERSEDEA